MTYSSAEVRHARPSRSIPSAKLRRERGASLVEFALLAPLLAALLFGIIDFGMTLNDGLSTRQGAREAARQTITGRIGTDISCTLATSPPNSAARKVACLTKDRVGIADARVRVKINVQSPYQAGNALQICVMTQLESVSGFFAPILDDKVQQSAVQMLVEQTTDQAAESNVDDVQAYDEGALPGSSWSCAIAPAT